jgi:hypothetical protein
MENNISRFKLHVRKLTNPVNNIMDMIDLAGNYYRPFNISIDLLSTFKVDPQGFNQIQIRPECQFEDQLTEAESELFSYARDYQNVTVNPLECVVYVVESTDPPAWGCVYLDPMNGSIIITKQAPIWTLTHEIGHYLGRLPHNEDEKNHLMNPDTRFTQRPYLYDEEINIIQNSEFLTVE